MLVPLALALLLGEAVMVRTYCAIIIPTLVVSVPVVLLPGKMKLQLNAAQGFPLVFLVWLLSCMFGALPFYVSGLLPRFSDAFFESTSGFTTTGASIIADVEALPLSLNLWRALMHWLGGMGIILLTVILVPLLGAGAFQLLKAEMPGPDKGRFTPKITTQAKILWLIYIGLTALECILLLMGGMQPFDAVFHAFSTMSSGGFSNRNSGIQFYQSAYIEWVCIVFMLFAGFNFSLIYQLFRGKFRVIIANSEARAYGLLTLVASVIIVLAIYTTTKSAGLASSIQTASIRAESIRLAIFHTASIITTTGFAADGPAAWPVLAQCTLFMLMFIGGCSGSTAGGVKVIRYVVLYKQMKNELKKMLYPRGVFNIQIDKKQGRKDVVHGVASFMFLYFILLLAGALLVSSAGVDIWNAANASLIICGNIGLGLGELSSGALFHAAPAYVKYDLCFLMIAGRLEMLTVIVLFTPEFWKRG
jgi:trk system potassium uptake protein TrkH